MTGGGSSLGPVRLTLANLPNHPHNPQPSNPPHTYPQPHSPHNHPHCWAPLCRPVALSKVPQSPRASHAVC